MRRYVLVFFKSICKDQFFFDLLCDLKLLPMNPRVYFLIIFNGNFYECHPANNTDSTSVVNEGPFYSDAKRRKIGDLDHPTTFTFTEFQKTLKIPLYFFDFVRIQFFGAFNQILIDTVYVLNNTYSILGKESVDMRIFSDLKTLGELKTKLDILIFKFMSSDIKLLKSNTRVKREYDHYANYIVNCEKFDMLQLKIAFCQLIENLKNVNMKELFLILLSSIKVLEPKESSNDFFGLVTFVLLVFPLNSSFELYRTLLIHLTAMFKMLFLEKHKNDIHLRNLLMQDIKEKIKEVLCNWLYPGNFNEVNNQLIHFILTNGNTKMWFNQFPVVLLLKERNFYYPKVFETIYKNLNSINSMNEVESDYFKCMELLFSIESFLLNRIKPSRQLFLDIKD